MRRAGLCRNVMLPQFQEKRAREKRERDAAAARTSVPIGQVMSNPFERAPPAPLPATELAPFNPFAAPEPEPEPVLAPEPEPDPTPEGEAAASEPAAAPISPEPEVFNPFAAPLEPSPPRPRPQPPPPRPAPVAAEPALPQRSFDFNALPVKAAPGVADVPVPEREIGVLYEEHAHEVNLFNPFKEQKARREAPYNPFGAGAAKAAPTATATPALAAPGKRADPAPPRKNNKNRPPPTRAGVLERQGEPGKLLCVCIRGARR